MTREDHIERHKMLHRYLDELFADFIIEHPNKTQFLKVTLDEFIEWSHEQTTNPSDREGLYKEEV